MKLYSDTQNPIMSSLLLLFSSCFFIAHSVRPASNTYVESYYNRQAQSLLAFKSEISYDPGNSMNDWYPNYTSFCDWSGVTCDSKKERVLSVILAGMGLDGTISPSLANLSFLHHIDLSSNTIHGEIPDSLARLQNLNHLDLSSNLLIGTIPISLKKLRSLNYLDLSFNNLEGDVDKGGVYANQSMDINLNGNSHLCGSIESDLPACPGGNLHLSSLTTIPAVVGFVTALILCCLLLGFLWARNTQSLGFDLSKAIHKILQKVEHPWISYEDLVIATDRFNDFNLLATSSSGSVYKGILTDGTPVAVKVLNLVNKESDKIFKAECKVLQKVRHRNLARIITTCSNPHFKGLVFEYLSNGDLEKYLYRDRGHVSELDLKQLLSIAIDIAHGVEYLHHDCYVQIVHCDIKPSNVLLAENMAARLTDFGISRLMDRTCADSLASTINLKGSVGYMAPEYGLNGRVSTRGDVYSYGILLLEMLTRKKPTDDMFEGVLNLRKWVNSVFPNRALEVVDKSLLQEEVSKEMEQCLVSLIWVGLLCSKDSPESRPTMRDVVSLLKGIEEDWTKATTSSSIKLRPTISNLLRDRGATIDCEEASDAQSSTY